MNKNNYDELNLRKFKMKSILPDATVLLLGKRRSGKCLSKGTKILMSNGDIKCVENIKVGDSVMGDDSTCRTVLATHNGRDVMYKVTNQLNESYTVNSQHILSLISTFIPTIKERDHNNLIKVIFLDTVKLKIVTKIFNYTAENKEYIYNQAYEFKTKNMNNIVNIPIQTYLQLPIKIQKFLYGYQKPVYFNESDVGIDPYLYGLISNNNYQYTRDHRILKYLNTTLPRYNSYLEYDPRFDIYNISGMLANNNTTINLQREYIINSVKVRLNLLMGILHSNNYFKNGFYTFYTNDSDSNSNFLNDLTFLIKSLGYSIYKVQSDNIVKVFIYNGAYPVLNSKDFFTQPPPQCILNDIQIECVGIQEYYGFQIDKNSLFFLDNCVVTHNSWLVRDIFYHHQHIPSGIVFSGTEEANPFFGEFIPDCFIHGDYDPEIIEKIMNKQKKKIRDAKRDGLKDGKCPSNNLFIVFDDMLHDAQNWKNEKTIKNIFFNGRHYNFLFILTMQYPLGITPALRSNIDYVFIFNEPSVKNRRKIYDDYAAMLPSFDHFCNILDACTQNHECLVIKTSGNSSDLRNIVFWYKAESHEDFRVGHPKFWKFHQQHYNKNYEDDNLEVDEKVNELKEKFSRTKKLKVIVSRQNDNIVDLEYSK